MAKYDKNKTRHKFSTQRTDSRRDPRFADLIRHGKPPGGFYRPGKQGTKQQ